MDFDISGPTADCRFPWQRDVAVQCTPPPLATADSASFESLADDVEYNNNAKKRLPSQSDPAGAARGVRNANESAAKSVNGRTSSDSALGDQLQLQQQQQHSLPGSPSVLLRRRRYSKEQPRVGGGSPPCFANCSADSISSSIGDESVGDEEDDKHMRQYTRSTGLGRRPAVISSYNFLGTAPGSEISADKKDNITEEVTGAPPGVERPRSEHRTNSMSAISRAAAYGGSSQPLSASKDADTKVKSRSLQSVLRIPARKKKPEALRTFLLNIYRRKEFGSDQLASYKRATLADILANKDVETGDTLAEAEMKKREAMWEVFTNECTFLFDQLLVLRHCFLDPLKEAQVEGHLLDVNLPRLFGNVEDLCQISYAFCHDFVQSLRSSKTGFCSMDDLVACLEKMVLNSHNGEAYEEYVLQYKGAVSYLTSLRESVPDFLFYESFCIEDARCNRLRLKDLLVAPMHHWTRLPVILKNVCRRTKQAGEKAALSAASEKVETSLRLIDDKMEELKPMEKLRELQKLLVWPTVTDLDPKAYVPEFLRDIIHDEPREVDLADQRRELIYEGPLQLLQGDKEKLADVYVLLLSDMVLITKSKKEAKKKDAQKKISINERSGGELAYYVQKQPMPVDSINVYDLKQRDSSASAIKNIFAITQSNVYQQTIAVATFQAPSEEAKMQWLESFNQARDRHRMSGSSNSSSRHDSFSRQFTEEEREKLRRCTRLLTVEDSAAWRRRSRISNGCIDGNIAAAAGLGVGAASGDGSGGNNAADGGGGAVGGGGGSCTNLLTIATCSSAIAKATAALGLQRSGGRALVAAALRTPSGSPPPAGGILQEPRSPRLVVAAASGEIVNQGSVDSADAVFF